MDLRKLKTLIDLVSESGISELEVTEGEGKVRIVKNAPPVYVQPSAGFAPQVSAPAPVVTAPSEAAGAAAAAAAAA
ncbi:acetyl-CoA carboxylase biotin carboxyl carrier protein, partial [Burkholderia pseudomallei]